MDDFFALLAPPPALPPTLPETPVLTPGSIILLLAGLAGALLKTQEQPQPEKEKEEAKQQAKQEHDDNKRVVKMKDVAKEIDRVLNGSLIVPIVFRGLLATLQKSPGGGFTDWTKIGQIVSDAEFDPVRRTLKHAIREHLLQQSNKRKETAITSNIRHGDLHKTFFGRPRAHPQDDPGSGPSFGNGGVAA